VGEIRSAQIFGLSLGMMFFIVLMLNAYAYQ
jgi:hypothetical protein